MPNYLQAYRLQVLNVEGALCTVKMFDTFSGLGVPTFTEVEGGGDPIHLFTINNDEVKVGAEIRALQLEVKFLSTPSVNLASFMDAQDNRWYVEFDVNGVLMFCGFAVLDDMDEDFLSDPNEVTMIATDNLGLLKDIPWVDWNDQNPRGYITLIEIIAQCLRLTGMDLPINVCCNIKDKHQPTEIMHQTNAIHAKSAEEEVGTSINAYDVLTNILSMGLYLTQYGGEWWIMRVNELFQYGTIRHQFDSSGNYVSSNDFDITQYIGPTESMKFSELATFVKYQQPVARELLTYNYNFPKEIFDNPDFERAKSPAYLTIPFTEDGIAKEEKRYVLEDWGFFTYASGGSSQIPVTTQGEAYIRRIFVDGYEKERYAVVHKNINGDFRLKSSTIPVGKLDKFNISLDWRFNADMSGSGQYTINTMQCRLRGYDGTFWSLHGGDPTDPIPRWEQTNGNFLANGKYVKAVGNLSEDQRQWKTVSAEAAPIPVAGELEIDLMAQTNNPNQVHFQNFRFDYMPYIVGSYLKYRGQQHILTNSLNTRKALEETVGISDGPRSLFKWALHYWNGTRWQIVDGFYEGLQFGSTVPGPADIAPYGRIQATDVWNQNNRTFRVFDFNCQGLNTNALPPSILHKFEINESHEHTNNKIFMLLHFDMDFHLCTWKGVLAEVEDRTIARVYDDPYEFKYISDR